ncbi:hypothetical protein F5887DRAFT_974384 [Amanita rubescens]|nr:hypothetical protein F5887DRAFT_974384 [Amanita rubescens]
MSLSRRPHFTDLISRLRNTQDFLRLLFDSRRTSLSLYYLAKLAKYIFFLLLLLNARSLPLAWHIRVFRPVFAIKLRHRWLNLRTALMSRQQKEIEEDVWMDRLCPVGQDPFETVVTYTSSASIDDSDFNGHLSNSSYAKTCDASRFKAALKFFPLFFGAGGWMPLAATHYYFIREIPTFASYEVRMSVQAWDQKWFYVALKFVTKPKKSNRESKSTAKTADRSPSDSTDSIPFIASLRIPAEGELTTAAGTPAESIAASSSETGKTLNAVSRGLGPKETTVLQEPDGAILHTIAISRLCFKVGRITVPPAVVLALHGFCEPPAQGAPYSHENPPSSFIQAKKIRSKLHGGSAKFLKAFFKDGWRDVPSGQRWWEDALGGSVEERRKARLGAMEELRRGMEGGRA